MSGWPIARLGDVAHLVGGGTPSKAEERFWGGDIPWASVRDMKSRWLTDTEFSITDEALKSSASNLVEAGNVVIATRVGLGKVVQVSRNTAINQDLRGVLPKDASTLCPEYIYYWYKTVAPVVISAGTGATVQGVRIPTIAGLLIPVPPLEEQKRIATKLDAVHSALKDFDLLVHKRRTLMWEMAQSWRDSRVTAPEVRRIPLRDLAEIRTGPFGSLLHKSDYGDDGVPVVNPINLVDGCIIPDKRVRNDRVEALSSYLLEAGHVVVARRGDLGRCAVVGLEQTGWLCGTGSFFVKCHSELLPDFLALFLDSSVVRAELAGASTGTTMSNLSNGTLGSLLIPAYEAEQQADVVRAWADIRAQVDAYVVDLTTSLQLSDALASSVARQVLSGAS